MKMQVQRIQNNNYNPQFRANRINIDIKLKMADLTDYLQKKVPKTELQSVDLNSMFNMANKNKKNDEEVAILTGNEIFDFLDIAWDKLKEKFLDLHFEMQNFIRMKRDEMWKSIERDFTPEQKVEMKNLIKLQKKYSNDMTKSARKITSLKQDDSGKVTQEQIKKAEEEYDLAAKQYHETSDKIYVLKYDRSKLDTAKYVDLEGK